MKNKIIETLSYIIFGFLTTFVNILCYYILKNFLNINYLTSNIMAWCLAVLFAYISNKKFVFKNDDYSLNRVLKELTTFIGSRLVTGLLDMVIMYISVDILYNNDFITKVVSNMLIIILNYLLSKFLIFKNRKI